MIAHSKGEGKYSDKELITFEIELHRYILPEFNTHRCIVGDTQLWFDLPNNGEPRLHKMSIKEFHDKWHKGAKQHTTPSCNVVDTSNLIDNTSYTAKEIATLLGVSASNIRTACRLNKCTPTNPSKKRGEDFTILGKEYKNYRKLIEKRTFSLRSNLQDMNIRMLNEDTNEIVNTKVTDVWEVGNKPVFELNAGKYSIKATADHPILTTQGWKELGDITIDDHIISCGFGVHEKRDPIQHKKINGVWTTEWNRKNKHTILERQDHKCFKCGVTDEPFDVHHIEPVYVNPEKAFDLSNVVAVCKSCHNEYHVKQDWQVSNKLLGKPVKVDSITQAGEEIVYDLSVESNYHNFVANGIVVHNCFSRNFQSSRAIPTMKQIKLILKDPALPVHWGTNNAGMSSNKQCGKFKSKIANGFRRLSSYFAIAGSLFESKVLGIHKQWSNRLLEPYMYTKGVFTTNKKGLANFLALRCAPDAQPEIKALADMIHAEYLKSEPKILKDNDYHLPYVSDEQLANLSIKDCIKISAASCASVSYRPLQVNVDAIWPRLGLDGNNENVHASPAEHQAKLAHKAKGRGGNFGNGWVQYRKTIPTEFKSKYLD